MDTEAEHDRRPPETTAALPHPGTEAYDALPQFPAATPLPFRRTIRRRELHQIVPLAESTIYEMEKRGEFPRRFRLTARCVVWDLDEVEAWVEARKTASRSGDVKTVPGPDVRRRQYRPVRPTHARHRS
ncbi:helix-turn-helix transcriptional regulator [Salinisphaera hydrothermalis]|uniref:helix-turn-helix transcriptional regulator n=1 Tax=Salinisphaera hydrothermalis TaxID=563188 RepID=UPI003340238D